MTTSLRRVVLATTVALSSLSLLSLRAAAEVPVADAQTTMIVDAAAAFIATLTDDQKAAVQFGFDDAAQRVNWSNFPLGGPGADRKGVKWGDMDDAQHAALIELLGTVLSPEGLTMVQEQVAADDAVAAADAKEKAGQASDSSRPPVSFGSAFYFVSFVGEPSATAPWMLQFGGHHLAINATVAGASVTLSPSLTGGQPLKFTYDGKPVYIVGAEAEAGAALLASLTDDQRGKAVLSDELGELVLGPGKDGMVLQPEGLPGSDMTDDQKALFMALIGTRLGMLNADDAAVAMEAVKTNLDQTTFGWWGPTDPVGAAYFRVTGPTVILEFAPQTQDGDPTDHAHSMYRDPTNEYGAAWAALQ
jgi:hypothetical protein